MPDRIEIQGWLRPTTGWLLVGAGVSLFARWAISRVDWFVPLSETSPLLWTWPVLTLAHWLLGAASLIGLFLLARRRHGWVFLLAILLFLLPGAVSASGAASENPMLLRNQLSFLLESALPLAMGVGVLVTSLAPRRVGWLGIADGVVVALRKSLSILWLRSTGGGLLRASPTVAAADQVQFSLAQLDMLLFPAFLAWLGWHLARGASPTADRPVTLAPEHLHAEPARRADAE